MRATPVVVVVLGLACVSSASCASSPRAQVVGPIGFVAPNEFVLRDVRKDAARYMRCQVPRIGVELGPWAGSEGNVVASGCGYQINYHLHCLTSFQCTKLAVD